MLLDCTQQVGSETILFEDVKTTRLACRDGVLRRVGPDDADRIFAHEHEPVGEWMIEVEGQVVATGGALHHYNPPYADIYMEVAEAHRRRGYGSYLVQEIRRVCYETGPPPVVVPPTSPRAPRYRRQGFCHAPAYLYRTYSQQNETARDRCLPQGGSGRGIHGRALSSRTPIPLKPYRVPRKTQDGRRFRLNTFLSRDAEAALELDLIA